MPAAARLQERRARVLVVSPTYPPTRCGVGDYTHRLAAALAAALDVHVLSARSQDPEHQHEFPETSEAVGHAPLSQPAPEELPAPQTTADGLHLYPVVDRWDWSCLPWVDTALRDLTPDVVNLQYHGEDFLLHPAVCSVAERARAGGAGVVTTFHNLQKPRGWTHGSEPLEVLLQTSDAWVTTNPIDAAEMQLLPEAVRKLHIVPTGPSFAARGERHTAATEEMQLAYFGFLNPAKGIEYALRAVALLRDAGLPLRLTLAAGLHTDATSRLRDYAHAIHSEIERLQLGKHVQQPGFLEEPVLRRLLLECDLGVFPFREGVCDKNTSFWTALEHGTPCLTTNGEALPDGLIDRDNVLLTPCRDPEALARQLRWAMQHRSQLPRIGRAGQAYVRHRLDWHVLAESMLRIYAACAPQAVGVFKVAPLPREERV